MQEEILIPITVFASLTVIVWLFQFFAARKRADALATLRAAIEKGQEITPEAMEAMTRLSHPLADLRQGIVWLSLAGAFAALAGIVGTAEPEAIRPLLGVGVFPLFLGVAFVLLHIFTGRRTSR